MLMRHISKRDSTIMIGDILIMLEFPTAVSEGKSDEVLTEDDRTEL